jgi:hypothetical protein
MSPESSSPVAEPRARFDVGSCLSLGFSIWARNLLPFATIAAVVHAPLLFYMLAVRVDPNQVAENEASVAPLLVIMLLGILLPMIATGALTYGVVQHVRGRPAGFGACVSVGLSRLLPVLGVGLLVGLCILGGLILLIIPAFIIMCMLWVAVPVAVIERPGVTASLRRSAELTKGHRWSIFGVIIVLGLIGGVATTVVSMMLSGAVLTVVSFVVGNVLMGSLQATVDAVAYWLLRSGRDGATIEDLAKVFD